MSTPLNASLMVLTWTSVMVLSFMFFVIVSMTFGSTSPNLDRSANSVMGPSDESWAASAAICCLRASLWKARIEELVARRIGAFEADVYGESGVRIALEA